MSRNVRLQLDAAATEALRKAKPDTPEFRLAMRDALQSGRDVAGALTLVTIVGDGDLSRALLLSRALQTASPGELDEHPSPQSAHRAFASRPL